MDKLAEIQNRLVKVSMSRANHVGRNDYLSDVRFLLTSLERMRDDLFFQQDIIRQLRGQNREVANEKEKGA